MTRGLGTADALWIWESGRDRHPVDRALLMLSAGHDGVPSERLEELSVGERDAALIDLRIATLGDRLDVATECPACAAAVEFSHRASALRVAGRRDGEAPSLELEIAGLRLRLRRPDSRDLARIACLPQGADPRRVLLRACLAPASADENPADGSLADGNPADGDPVDIDALSAESLAEIAARLADADPQADITFDLCCDACGHRWPLQFDIGSFFWDELAALAQRLVREVDALARVYGWREADILAMSPARRRLYLDMVT